MSVNDTFGRISADSRHREVQIVEWREIVKREFVNSFATCVRNTANDALFQKANLLPMFQRGTPRATTIHALFGGPPGRVDVQAGDRPSLRLTAAGAGLDEPASTLVSATTSSPRNP